MTYKYTPEELEELEEENIKLEDFSNECYTFINQIFGDGGIRDIITEIYVNNKCKFQVLLGEGEFSGSFHHVIMDGPIKKCSVEMGIQDMDTNVNDTLCQSYSLLLYLKKFQDFNDLELVPNDPENNQFNIIEMYRRLLQNKTFIKRFKFYFKFYDIEWVDFRTDDLLKPINNKTNEKAFTKLINKIKSVLDQWKSFGFNYYIGDFTTELKEYKKNYKKYHGLNKKSNRR